MRGLATISPSVTSLQQQVNIKQIMPGLPSRSAMLRPNPHQPSDALLQRDKSVRLSRYFMPVLKETPGEAQVISHQLMLRAAMVRQTSSGIYAWLPLGKRVLGEPRIGAHGSLIFFVHPKDMGGVLTEIMETPKGAH